MEEYDFFVYPKGKLIGKFKSTKVHYNGENDIPESIKKAFEEATDETNLQGQFDCSKPEEIKTRYFGLQK